MADKPAVLCIAGALFGRPFLIQAKQLGWRVYLMTVPKLLQEAWPRDVLDDIFAVPDLFDRKVVRRVVCYLGRTIPFQRIIGLGEFDIEVAADLREYLRIPGMGETTARYFRDKLAMRMKAEEDGIPVPKFSRIFYYPDLEEFLDQTTPPWLLKARFSSTSYQILKLESQEEVWRKLSELGDHQNDYLIEQFVESDVYHVDSLIYNGEVVFAVASQYGSPLLELTASGGVFVTRMLERGSEEEQQLQELNRKVIESFGMKRGVTHIEFLRSRSDGQFYLLEAAARVAGARIPDVIWHATGICLWHEWAKMELWDAEGKPYELPEWTPHYGAGIFTLARQEWPDLSAYNDPEVAWVQKKKYYAGLVLTSPDPQRLNELIADYVPRFQKDFSAAAQYKFRPDVPAGL